MVTKRIQTPIGYYIGDMVYLKTDPDQHPRIVMGVWLRPDGVLYQLNKGESTSWHFELEMIGEPDIVKKTSE